MKLTLLESISQVNLSEKVLHGLTIGQPVSSSTLNSAGSSTFLFWVALMFGQVSRCLTSLSIAPKLIMGISSFKTPRYLLSTCCLCVGMRGSLGVDDDPSAGFWLVERHHSTTVHLVSHWYQYISRPAQYGGVFVEVVSRYNLIFLAASLLCVLTSNNRKETKHSSKSYRHLGLWHGPASSGHDSFHPPGFPAPNCACLLLSFCFGECSHHALRSPASSLCFIVYLVSTGHYYGTREPRDFFSIYESLPAVRNCGQTEGFRETAW